MDEKEKNKRNKLILFGIALLFTALSAWLMLDFMNRTSRPGSKKHLPTSILR
jgi:hypothetical protein